MTLSEESEAGTDTPLRKNEYMYLNALTAGLSAAGLQAALSLYVFLHYVHAICFEQPNADIGWGLALFFLNLPVPFISPMIVIFVIFFTFQLNEESNKPSKMTWVRGLYLVVLLGMIFISSILLTSYESTASVQEICGQYPLWLQH